MRTTLCTLTATAVLLISATAVQAAGSSPLPSMADSRGPEQLAVDSYNRGLVARNKAWKYEEKAAEESGSARAKLEEKALKQFEKAVRPLERAVELNPRLYQAHTSLGYVLRRIGDYPASLSAYDRALTLNPNYEEAIEYRAEALLGLNRVEAAQQAHERLIAMGSSKWRVLFDAIAVWVDERQSDPQGVAPEVLASAAEWVESRRRVLGESVDVASTSAW